MVTIFGTMQTIASMNSKKAQDMNSIVPEIMKALTFHATTQIHEGFGDQ